MFTAISVGCRCVGGNGAQSSRKDEGIFLDLFLGLAFLVVAILASQDILKLSKDLTYSCFAIAGFSISPLIVALMIFIFNKL